MSTVDDDLDSLEKLLDRLRDDRLPLEDLTSAHERAVQLLTQIEKRLSELKEKLDSPKSGSTTPEARVSRAGGVRGQ